MQEPPYNRYHLAEMTLKHWQWVDPCSNLIQLCFQVLSSPFFADFYGQSKVWLDHQLVAVAILTARRPSRMWGVLLPIKSCASQMPFTPIASPRKER